MGQPAEGREISLLRKSYNTKYFNDREKQINWRNPQDTVGQWIEYTRAGRNALCCRLLLAGVILGLFSHEMLEYMNSIGRNPGDRLWQSILEQ